MADPWWYNHYNCSGGNVTTTLTITKSQITSAATKQSTSLLHLLGRMCQADHWWQLASLLDAGSLFDPLSRGFFVILKALTSEMLLPQHYAYLCQHTQGHQSLYCVNTYKQ